jgi:hypothetical protein
MGDQVVPIQAQSQNLNPDDRKDIQRLKRSEAGKRASAVATAEMLSSLMDSPNLTPQTRENALRVLNELTPQLEEVTGQVSEPEIVVPAGYQQQEVVQEEEPVSFDYELPADVAALLEDDEPEDEEEETFLPAAEEDDELTLAEDEDDPRVAQLQAQLAKERKRTEHERKLRVQSSSKTWAAEARKVFNGGPVELLSDDEIDGIKADSKKDFFRKAKALADHNRKIAERFAPRAAAAPDAEQIRAEERARAEAAWGKPANAGVSAPASREQQDALQRARRTGRLENSLKAMIYGAGEE